MTRHQQAQPAQKILVVYSVHSSSAATIPSYPSTNGRSKVTQAESVTSTLLVVFLHKTHVKHTLTLYDL